MEQSDDICHFFSVHISLYESYATTLINAQFTLKPSPVSGLLVIVVARYFYSTWMEVRWD